MALTADFHKDLAGEGAVHWDLAMHPYPSPEMDCRFWNRTAFVTDSGSSGQITMANARAFAEYIKKTYGKSTHIIMSETGICALDQDGTNRVNDQAAAVALAYYLTEFDSNIDMIGIHREMDEAGLREREERKKAKEQRKKTWKKFSLIFLLVTVIVLTAGAVLLVLSDSFGDAGIAMAVIGSLLIVTGAFSLFALAFCFLGWIREMITGQDS